MAARRRVYTTINHEDPVEITGDYGVLPENSYVAIKGNFSVFHDSPGASDLSAVSLLESAIIKTTTISKVPDSGSKDKDSMGILIHGSMSSANGAQLASYDRLPTGYVTYHEFNYNNAQNYVKSFQMFVEEVLEQLKKWNYSVHIDSTDAGFGALDVYTLPYDNVTKVMPE